MEDLNNKDAIEVGECNEMTTKSKSTKKSKKKKKPVSGYKKAKKGLSKLRRSRP